MHVKFCMNMRGASPLTTIDEPAKLLRSIVVRPLAGLMPLPCGNPVWGQVIMPLDLACTYMTTPLAYCLPLLEIHII